MHYVSDSEREDEATIDELNAWREEMQLRLQQESDFIAQLRACSSTRHSSDNEQYVTIIMLL